VRGGYPQHPIGMISRGRQQVLFVDPSHGARSQMAAALLRSAAGDRFEVSSAGIESSGSLNQVAEALREVGVDFSADRRAIADALDRPPDLLVVVCEEGCGHCPYVPGARRVVRWPQPDPDASGVADRTTVLRRIRGDLQLRIAYLVNLPESGALAPGGPEAGERDAL
jgi:protein-tyrosine-phosphatase